MERLHCLNAAAEYVQVTQDIQMRFMGLSRRLKSAYAICFPSGELTDMEVSKAQFYLAVRSIIYKQTKGDAPDAEIMNSVVENMVREVISCTGIENIDERLRKVVDEYNSRDKFVFTSGVVADFVNNLSDKLIQILKDLQTDKTSFEQLGVTFEEKSFFDILVKVRDDKTFPYEDEKCLVLAKKIKELVDDKAQFADWSTRDDIKNQLNMELTVLLYENGYPPEWNEEVFADMIFSSNPSDIAYFWGEGKKDSVDIIKKNFGSLMPCVHGSDAHCNNKIFAPDGDRFCWIKAEPTFEGLQQILYEPKERVRISSTIPDIKPGYYVIDRAQIVGNKNFSPEPIYFSDKLTCIIGGKSTGKSLLLHNMAAAIDSTQVRQKEKAASTSVKPPPELKVFWADGVCSTDSDKQRKIVYIPQTYLNRRLIKLFRKLFCKMKNVVNLISYSSKIYLYKSKLWPNLS